MYIFKLLIVLLNIVVLVKFNKPLYISIGAAIVATLVLFNISFSNYPSMVYNAIFGIDTIKLLISFYGVTFLQRMLEKFRRKKKITTLLIIKENG